MKILLFHATTDSDLHKGLQVCYQDINGQFTKLGVITDTAEQDGTILYMIDSAMGAYAASELKLIAPVNIKESNYWSIYDFAMSRNRPEMQGTKLQALFKLIELKGDPVETNEPKLQGLKAMQIKKGEYIAIRRTAINGSFYPCKLETFLLTEL